MSREPTHKRTPMNIMVTAANGNGQPELEIVVSRPRDAGKTPGMARRPAWQDDETLGPRLHAKAEAWRERLTADDTGATWTIPASGVSVCVRVRPMLAHERVRLGGRIEGNGPASFAQFEYEACVVERSARKVHLLSEARKLGAPTGELDSVAFDTDDVFGAADDDAAVFASAVEPLVQLAAAGGSAALIAFGQTSAGKTHTAHAMQIRAASALLEAGASYIDISFYEILGDRLHDLLRAEAPPPQPAADAAIGAPDAAPMANEAGAGSEGADGGTEGGAVGGIASGVAERVASLELRETAGGLRVCGLREISVSSVADAAAVLDAANVARATAPTAANDRSSRSHAVCVLSPRATHADAAEADTGADAKEGSEAIATSAAKAGGGGRLFIVDLAGVRSRATLMARRVAYESCDSEQSTRIHRAEPLMHPSNPLLT